MHTKDIGIIGDMKVSLDLKMKGYPIFSEVGDNSRVDIIALVGSAPVKVQVKTVSEMVNGAVYLSLKKTGPGYQFFYERNDVDVFALYVLETDEIAYLSANSLFDRGAKGISLRVIPSANNQIKGINMFSDYGSFEEALRDYTPSALPQQSGGDEIVQTATREW